MSDDVIVGKPLRFRLERPYITYDCPGDTVQRCLLIFGRWLLPLSRKRKVAA